MTQREARWGSWGPVTGAGNPSLKSSRFTSGRTSQGSSRRLVSEQGLDLPSPLRITYVRALPASPRFHRAVLGWTLLGGQLQAATGRKPHPLFPFSVPCAPWKKSHPSSRQRSLFTWSGLTTVQPHPGWAAEFVTPPHPQLISGVNSKFLEALSLLNQAGEWTRVWEVACALAGSQLSSGV